MIVADSDVLIDGLRGRKPVVDRIALELNNGALATTVINCFELLSGAKSEMEHKKVEKLLGALIILPVDEGASRRAAEVRRHLESEGLGIGMADYLIAGVCLERDLVLLTRNREHFERIAGLAIGRM